MRRRFRRKAAPLLGSLAAQSPPLQVSRFPTTLAPHTPPSMHVSPLQPATVGGVWDVVKKSSASLSLRTGVSLHM